MSQIIEISTGASTPIALTLDKPDGTPQALSGTISTSLVSRDYATLLAGPENVSEAEAGSDWANGVIVHRWGVMAAELTTQPAVIEVRMNDGTDEFVWRGPAHILKSHT